MGGMGAHLHPRSRPPEMATARGAGRPEPRRDDEASPGLDLAAPVFTVQPWSVCLSPKTLHRVCLSFPQASVRQSCLGCSAIQDVNIIPGNATAFSALSAFFRVCFPKDVEIYHLEGTVQKARDLLLRNQETLTFKTCLKSIFHTKMRQMSPASAPGVYWASMWSQRRGQNSAQRGYFRFGAEIHYLPPEGSLQRLAEPRVRLILYKPCLLHCFEGIFSLLLHGKPTRAFAGHS